MARQGWQEGIGMLDERWIEDTKAKAAKADEDLKKGEEEVARLQEELARLREDAEKWSRILEVATGAKAAEHDGSQSGQGSIGLRDAVKRALGASDRGLRPREVTSHLVESGFHYSANTPLATRVANELHRMVKTGHLRRTRGGLYGLPRPK